MKVHLFIDIETVAVQANYEALPPRLQACWLRKARFLGAATEAEQKALFPQKAGIFAEFGQIIVIGMGYIAQSEGREVLRLETLSGKDEKLLLTRFATMLGRRSPLNTRFCGHNIKEFDLPYISRRKIVHGIPLLSLLDTAGKKPWEVDHLDTMALWKFGDYKHYTSLELLTALMDIPSSKEAMRGDAVHAAYYEHDDLAAIARYCTEDVIATVQLYRRLQGLPLIDREAMHFGSGVIASM